MMIASTLICLGEENGMESTSRLKARANIKVSDHDNHLTIYHDSLNYQWVMQDNMEKNCTDLHSLACLKEIYVNMYSGLRTLHEDPLKKVK